MRQSSGWIKAMALGALIVLLAACGESRSAASGATPEEAIERYFVKVGVPVAPARDGVVRLSMREIGGGTLGLY
ncbi:MAG TPA: hypothetical protein VD886_24365, partial [Herpetosiphonaceae bacterium]|nr:hypothetical protein [Herpetosiphonaceae bacterium]